MYKINIIQIDEVEKEVKEYQKLHNKVDFNSDEDPQYDYVETTKMVEVETSLYSQQTNREIDLMAVINAFNKEV